MLTILVILSIWLLLNVLFVLIVVPPRKSSSRPDAPGTSFAPAPIDKHQGQLDDGEPVSLRHAFISRALGTIFILASPLIAVRVAIVRLWKSMQDPGQRR
ncbi:hypothetical protein [Bradyrhizobium sp. Ec3.3]|uniref:hypothetical protein n=1 Tax=Bradyrhizobium sp. Ec3.3 TaxID=189753 RepID=UPI00040CA0C6|nr:hypothetical protein [Bradyrhizobium sp. Ec3.3]